MVHNGTLNIGGIPWIQQSNGILLVTNFSGVDAIANGTYVRQSSTFWFNTNNFIYGQVQCTMTTNGAACFNPIQWSDGGDGRS